MSDLAVPQVVTADTTARFVDRFGDGPEIAVRLVWDPINPCAVSVEFLLPSRSVEWIVARDLLGDGLVGPAGWGDVRVAPFLRPADGVLLLTLDSPSGCVTFLVDGGPLAGFLTATYREFGLHAPVDVDCALADLLDES